MVAENRPKCPCAVLLPGTPSVVRKRPRCARATEFLSVRSGNCRVTPRSTNRSSATPSPPRSTDPWAGELIRHVEDAVHPPLSSLVGQPSLRGLSVRISRHSCLLHSTSPLLIEDGHTAQLSDAHSTRRRCVLSCCQRTQPSARGSLSSDHQTRPTPHVGPSGPGAVAVLSGLLARSGPAGKGEELSAISGCIRKLVGSGWPQGRRHCGRKRP